MKQYLYQLAEGQCGPAQRLAAGFFLLDDKVLEVHHAKLFEAIDVTLFVRRCGLACRLSNDLRGRRRPKAPAPSL